VEANPERVGHAELYALLRGVCSGKNAASNFRAACEKDTIPAVPGKPHANTTELVK